MFLFIDMNPVGCGSSMCACCLSAFFNCSMCASVVGKVPPHGMNSTGHLKGETSRALSSKKARTDGLRPTAAWSAALRCVMSNLVNAASMSSPEARRNPKNSNRLLRIVSISSSEKRDASTRSMQWMPGCSVEPAPSPQSADSPFCSNVSCI